MDNESSLIRLIKFLVITCMLVVVVFVVVVNISLTLFLVVFVVVISLIIVNIRSHACCLTSSEMPTKAGEQHLDGHGIMSLGFPDNTKPYCMNKRSLSYDAS